MNLFYFKGKWFRKVNRPQATTISELVPEDEMLALFTAIHKSFETANLTDLDTIQSKYMEVVNGKILRRHW